MKPAPVQNSSAVATLHSSFFSLFNNCVAPDSYRDYPELREGSSRLSRDTSRTLLSLLLACFIFPSFLLAQFDSNSLKSPTLQSSSNDTSLNHDLPRLVPNVSPYLLLTPEQKKRRQWMIGGLNVVGYGSSILIFNNQWYKNHPRTSFHTFNDSKEWLQMDKLGHVWASYNSGRASAAMWRWAGVSDKNAVWIGGLSSTVYLTVIEFLDAHSSKWGWSWADMGANIFGSALFIGQYVAWREERLQFKFSFHHKKYSDPMLKQRADDLFGSSWTERMLKDYNGQTYWLSANLKSFFPESNLPAWLNVAIGYGADGMFGGFENKWTNGDPGFPVDRTDINRYRQWYLAPDINFSKIKTNSKAVRVLFAALDAFKFPSPSLELSNGKLKVNAIHF